MAGGIFRKFGMAGRNDPERGTLWTTPWSHRTAMGIYVGWNGEVWIYRALPLAPQEWEDPAARVSASTPLAQLLGDLGQTSSVPLKSLRTGANLRQIHLLQITWEDTVDPPAANSEELKDYQSEILTFIGPQRALFIGVKLRNSLLTRAKNSGSAGVWSEAKKMLAAVSGESDPDLDLYRTDRDLISAMIARYPGSRIPTREEFGQLESWYNLGRGPDVTIEERRSELAVSDFDTIELSAVMSFDLPQMSAPADQWILDAVAHQGDAPHVVSIRADLEPSALTRTRAHRSQRRVVAQMEEEAKTGDIERVENSTTLQHAQMIDAQLSGGGPANLSAVSIIMAKRESLATETYVQFMESRYGIVMKPLEHRQMEALEETLPCSSKRLSPFLQDMTIPTLAYAGLQAFSKLGDTCGGYIGLADPDYSAVFMDFLAASARDLPPATLIAGDPGSGKTLMAQKLALEAALSGLATFYINPKGSDSLIGMIEMARELGIPCAHVRMSALQATPGAFDPFRFAPPLIAAEILYIHILSALEEGLSIEERLELGSGLKRGANAGARCAGEALQYVASERTRRLIQQQGESDAKFALALSPVPLEPITVDTQRLTLLEFDTALGLPEGKNPGEYSASERIALAAVRLVTRAALEILITNGGGVLLLDEAWTFLGHPEGVASLTRLSREGRSLNVLPVFITQRVGDVLNKDLEGYLSRVFALKCTDRKDAVAALRACHLDATEERIAWLRDCGPQRDEHGNPTRWAMALHRDLYNGKSAVALGPTPPDLLLALSTNPEDRKRRKAQQVELAQALALADLVVQEKFADVPGAFDTPAVPVGDDQGAATWAQGQGDRPIHAGVPGGPPGYQSASFPALPPNSAPPIGTPATPPVPPSALAPPVPRPAFAPAPDSSAPMSPAHSVPPVHSAASRPGGPGSPTAAVPPLPPAQHPGPPPTSVSFTPNPAPLSPWDNAGGFAPPALGLGAARQLPSAAAAPGEQPAAAPGFASTHPYLPAPPAAPVPPV